MLFRLLSKLAALDENESSLLQLAFCIAPPICRPVTSAYMSIRHMEDLKRARPVVSFLVENYDDIFFNLAPLRAAQTPMSPGDSGRGLSGSHSMLIDPPAPFSPAVMSPKSPSGSVSSRSGDESSSSGGGGDRSFHLVRPNLLVMIPPAGGAAPDSLSLEVDVDGYGGGKQPPGRHYSDAEWNVSSSACLHVVHCLTAVAVPADPGGTGAAPGGHIPGPGPGQRLLRRRVLQGPAQVRRRQPRRQSQVAVQPLGYSSAWQLYSRQH